MPGGHFNLSLTIVNDYGKTRADPLPADELFQGAPEGTAPSALPGRTCRR